MTSKEKLSKIVKSARELKSGVQSIGQDAKERITRLRGIMNETVRLSEKVMDRAKTIRGNILTKDKIHKGLLSASRGVGLLAKGADWTSIGVKKLARGMEKTSSKIGQLGKKMNPSRPSKKS